MGKKISWLHLSDLHFRCSQDEFMSQLIYKKLLEDLKHINEKIDFIFVTGDIAFSGQKKEYERASDFFNEALKILKVTRDHLFFVPGNHDIQRSKFANYISNILAETNSEKEVSVILGDKELRTAFLKKLDDYYGFVRENSFAIDNSELSYTKNINVNGIEIAIVGLNSVWGSSSSSEKGNIVLGERQVIEAYSKIKNPKLTITLLHHPIYYFRDEDAEKVEAIINNRSDFVLHGHIHNLKVISQKMPDSMVHYLVAGASYDDNGSTYNLAYNYVSADLDSGTVDIHVKRFNNVSSCWEDDRTLSKNGKVHLLLPSRIVEKEYSTTYDYREANSNYVKEEQKYVVNTENVPLVIPTVPKQLLNNIKNNKCVLFAGAGTSIDAKIPSWSELVATLVECLKDECSDLLKEELEELEKLFCEKKYLVLAEYCMKKMGAYVSSQILKEKLACNGKKSLTHDLLAQIPFKAIITTNLDQFIEQTNAAHGHMYKVILPNDMNILDCSLNNVLPILKIHGSYENPESVVLTKGKIRELLFDKPHYNEILKRYFTENTILFYGYSFNDPDIDFILQEVMADNKGHTKKHYALLPDVGKIEAQYLLEEYNVQVISYKTEEKSHLAARKFLERIVKAL